MKIYKTLVLLFSLLIGFFLSSAALASNSVAGYWKVMESGNSQPTALVKITQQGNSLQGRIVKVFSDPNATCEKCPGDMQGKPLVGLPVLWGFSKAQDGQWHGKVLAVRRGKIFDGTLNLSGNGQTLQVEVDTFLGKRSQTWVRAG